LDKHKGISSHNGRAQAESSIVIVITDISGNGVRASWVSKNRTKSPSIM